MNLKDNDSGERPDGSGLCFYCGEKTGSPHGGECVIPEKSVVIKIELEYVVSVPKHWDRGHLEWHRNEGSWCVGNDLAKLADSDTCGCGSAVITFQRDATEEDHRDLIDTTSANDTL